MSKEQIKADIIMNKFKKEFLPFHETTLRDLFKTHWKTVIQSIILWAALFSMIIPVSGYTFELFDYLALLATAGLFIVMTVDLVYTIETLKKLVVYLLQQMIEEDKH